MRDHWQPAVPGTRTYARRPEIGALIAADRRPWRVVEVNERQAVDWHDRAREEWLSAGLPEAWDRRPFIVVLRPARGGKAVHVEINPWHWSSWWEPLPEHYAVCVDCGELAPCLEITAAYQAAHDMRRFDMLASVLPGCCWGCSEPISARQDVFTFPGPNVWLPTAPDDVRIHTRRKCIGAAQRYEEAWVQADPTRPRSLLTLRCKGSLVVHGDGSAECFGAAESDCPSVYAHHGSMTACFSQTHGCGRECRRDGHPGCRVNRPKIVQDGHGIRGDRGRTVKTGLRRRRAQRITTALAPELHPEPVDVGERRALTTCCLCCVRKFAPATCPVVHDHPCVSPECDRTRPEPTV